MNTIKTEGPPPESADAALILLHGRGASAEHILTAYRALNRPNVAALALEAPGGTWYPYSFMAPIEQNQPHLDRALQRVEDVVTDLLARGVASHRIALLGFSQGACLASEYVIRHPRRYGAVMVLTGGFIGPPGTVRSEAGEGLDGTPVFLGANDPDGHVPFSRVQDTADWMTRLGAQVEVRRYPGMPHTIVEDELDACRALLDGISA